MSELARSTHGLRSPSGTMMPWRYFKCFALFRVKEWSALPSCLVIWTFSTIRLKGGDDAPSNCHRTQQLISRGKDSCGPAMATCFAMACRGCCIRHDWL
ncbi:hypothetical protein [Bradyrhizobium erythrophlei]|uniref:hypothetical protein n=1 Tax=Bradyrhizobium erythrophlei TaxID=1437360 RepID=UPI00116008E4|nr:hypothetical protein [Bradyrhizobium erythrophlei]